MQSHMNAMCAPVILSHVRSHRHVQHAPIFPHPGKEESRWCSQQGMGCQQVWEVLKPLLFWEGDAAELIEEDEQVHDLGS